MNHRHSTLEHHSVRSASQAGPAEHRSRDMGQEAEKPLPGDGAIDPLQRGRERGESSGRGIRTQILCSTEILKRTPTDPLSDGSIPWKDARVRRLLARSEPPICTWFPPRRGLAELLIRVHDRVRFSQIAIQNGISLEGPSRHPCLIELITIVIPWVKPQL